MYNQVNTSLIVEWSDLLILIALEAHAPTCALHNSKMKFHIHTKTSREEPHFQIEAFLIAFTNPWYCGQSSIFIEKTSKVISHLVAVVTGLKHFRTTWFISHLARKFAPTDSKWRVWGSRPSENRDSCPFFCPFYL